MAERPPILIIHFLSPTATPFTMHLPQELVETIIDGVDFNSLQSCASVATAFLTPCRRRIFRSIYLGSHTGLCGWSRIPNVVAVDRVQSGLMRAPHIIPYVRNVTLLMSKSEPNLNPHAEAVLRALTHIESLVIHGFSRIEISGSLSSAICEVLERPTLDTLHLRAVAVPQALMARAMSSVRTVLLVQGVSISDAAAGSDGGAPGVRPPRLEQLLLPGSNALDVRIQNVLDLLVRENHLHRLRRLALRVQLFPVSRSTQLLMHISRTLDHLELIYDDSYWRPPSPLIFPRLSALQYLQLRIRLGWDDGLPADLSTTVTALGAAAPGIHTLTFAFTIPVRRSSWAFVLFDVSAALPGLRCVRFLLMFNKRDAEHHEGLLQDHFRGFVAAIRRGLPALVLQGTTLVEFDWAICQW
ncbi:hypothetical protein C8R44DRAFT_785962 [Mycena epipterygia]|nr:hypothetical protein C8R44DRAFT_785962 [Mycena epipterygia]